MTADGKATLNVYLDRQRITMTFAYRRYGIPDFSYTGLYGQPLSRYGYEWPEGAWEYAGINGTSGMSFLGQFVLPDNVWGNTINFTSKGSSSSEVRFYLQGTDGTSYPAVPSGTGYTQVTGYTRRFQFTEKCDGFTVSEYRIGRANGAYTLWQSVSSGQSVMLYWGDNLEVRYRRRTYTVKFLDSMNGAELEGLPSQRVVYGASLEGVKPTASSISSYHEGYEWDGQWYAD